MKESATIKFKDEETAAIVRYDADSVALCLSHKSNGDIMVIMNKNDARALIDALKKAV